MYIVIKSATGGDERSMWLHYHVPEDTRREPDSVLMLVHRLRRWANIKTASGHNLSWRQLLFPDGHW